jgi:hypothetical protein
MRILQRAYTFDGQRMPLVRAVQRVLREDDLDAPTLVKQLVGTVLNQLKKLPATVSTLYRSEFEVVMLLDKPRCLSIRGQCLLGDRRDFAGDA